ncbi:MAG: peptide chain release factor 1 [Myxococcota bacterium]|jgi:peptide chain release factor 1|nr:peptide chain release factor 1 [Myxococcota bacterium]
MSKYLNRIEEAEERARELEAQVADPELAKQPGQYQKVARALGALRPLLEAGERYRAVVRELEDSRSMIEDSDAELAELARAETVELETSLTALEGELAFLLTPRDPNDDKNVILEIRAGTGGDEAALFAADLFRMYARFSELASWKVERMSSSETPGGGFKEIIALVKGDGAWSRLKYERGVHRVQRVPATEAQGRIHTSTVTVAVMPEAEEVDIDISPTDLRIDVMRASGPGGQSVNTTDSAVRITHLPTGVVVQCQDEKSQHKNKAKAMTVLRSRLLEFEEQKAADERASERRSQVGTGERSEKIRTYNFPQSRVTDHRAGVTLHKLGAVMEGDLQELLDSVKTQITAQEEAQREA